MTDEDDVRRVQEQLEELGSVAGPSFDAVVQYLRSLPRPQIQEMGVEIRKALDGTLMAGVIGAAQMQGRGSLTTSAPVSVPLTTPDVKVVAGTATVIATASVTAKAMVIAGSVVVGSEDVGRVRQHVARRRKLSELTLPELLILAFLACVALVIVQHDLPMKEQVTLTTSEGLFGTVAPFVIDYFNRNNGG